MSSRIIVVSALFLLYGAGLVARLFYLQILQHDELVALSDRQHLKTEEIFYGRGMIYDRNMSELASNIQFESVYVTPSKITDKKKTAAVLASALDLNEREVRKKISQGKGFVWIKRKCPSGETDLLRRAGLSGVDFVTEDKRFYPKRQLASGALGFVGIDNQGLSGIEHQYDSLLQGATVKVVMEKDNKGRFVRAFDESTKPVKPSRDLVLTIDEVIQFTAEYHLRKQVEKYKAKSGVVVVMDPDTGDILALASVPQFNPNNALAYPRSARDNRAVVNSYEPGSIFKPILAAAALDAGVTQPQDTFFCENGKFNLGQVQIGEASDHKFGNLSLNDIIAKSSNIGAIKIAQKLGSEKYYDYIRKFGFGSKTEVGLPGESSGLLKGLSEWSPLSLASISFGHEIGVTPIQMTAAIAAIANGGKLMKPRIVKSILKDGKVVETFKPEIVHRVISQKTSRQMIDILQNVVRDGTGKEAAVAGFEVAGKTGTAQKFDNATQSYSKTGYLSSFIGFAPANAAKVVVLVMIDEPQGSYWGGSVAGPVFSEVSKQVLRYLNVPASGERVYILDRA